MERRAGYRSKCLRGIKKHNEGYHRGDKVQKKKDSFTNVAPDTDTLRQRDLGADEAERARISLTGMHRALNWLQRTFRRSYCRGCVIKSQCDGFQCRVAVEIIPHKQKTRIWRPMPKPDRALPLELGKPSGKKGRILPRREFLAVDLEDA